MNNSVNFETVKPALLKLLLKSYQEIPYYRNLFDSLNINPQDIDSYEKYCQIPLLTKDTYRNSTKDFFPSRFNKESPESDPEVSLRFTSGSTGKPLPVYVSKGDKGKINFQIGVIRQKFLTKNKYDSSWLGVYPTTIQTMHLLREYGDQQFSQEAEQKREFNIKNGCFVFLHEDSEQELERLYQALIRFNPAILAGVTSLLHSLALYINKHHKDVSHLKLQHIECNSEYLPVWQRKNIREAFHIEPVNIYAANEMRLIGYECNKLNMHVIERVVFLELINQDENGYGEVVITTLGHTDMPFIRYQLGDTARFGISECTCNLSGPVLELKECRANDLIIFPDRKVHFYAIADIIHILCVKNSIYFDNYLFYQRNYTDFEFYIDNISDDNKRMFEQLFSKYFFDVLNSKDLNLKFIYDKYKPMQEQRKLSKYKHFLTDVK